MEPNDPLDAAVMRGADDRAWAVALPLLRAGREIAPIPDTPLLAVALEDGVWGPSLSPSRLEALVAEGALSRTGAGRYRLNPNLSGGQNG